VDVKKRRNTSNTTQEDISKRVVKMFKTPDGSVVPVPDTVNLTARSTIHTSVAAVSNKAVSKEQVVSTGG
jgi:hypothetical protein